MHALRGTDAETKPRLIHLSKNVSQQQDQGKLEQIYKQECNGLPNKKHLSVPSNLLGKECENI